MREGAEHERERDAAQVRHPGEVEHAQPRARREQRSSAQVCEPSAARERERTGRGPSALAEAAHAPRHGGDAQSLGVRKPSTQCIRLHGSGKHEGDRLPDRRLGAEAQQEAAGAGGRALRAQVTEAEDHAEDQLLGEREQH